MRRFSTFAKVSLVETITIDDLDRQLTQCLGVDGRASFSAIADVLGVSDQTVARRYRRLRSAGVLRVVGLKYPKSAGYANWFLRLRCVPGSGEAIAAALAQRSDTAWVQLLSGDTEVLCSLRGDASDGTESLLTRLPRSGRIDFRWATSSRKSVGDIPHPWAETSISETPASRIASPIRRR